MINIQSLKFSYPGCSRIVFDDIDLELEPGHIYGLLGKNGVGKSTLFRLISGVNKPTAGSIQTLGFTPWDRDPEMLQDVFIIPEDMEFPNVSIDNFAMLYGEFYPNFNVEQLNHYLSIFEIDSTQSIAKMSQGQRKKALIAFALAVNTRILLLDEPTNGLDIPSKRMFRSCLEQVALDDRIIIISTHQVRDLEELIDAVLVMHEKTFALNALVSDLLAKYHFGELNRDEKGIFYEDAGLHRYGVKPRSPGDNPDAHLDLEILFSAAIAGAFKE